MVLEINYNKQKKHFKSVKNDPWKSRTGGLVDMNVIREKRGNEIVKNMNSNFAKETNQRDEDAEMQKFIEMQLKLRNQAEREKEKTSRGILDEDKQTEAAGDGDDEASGKQPKYKSPNDVLFDLPKFLLQTKNKSEETFTEEVLSGIPEVDLGIEERIRNIEETERAKQSLFAARGDPAAEAAAAETSQAYNHHYSAPACSHESRAKKATTTTAKKPNEPSLSSVNFVQHKRFDETLINAEKQRALNMSQMNSKQTRVDDQPVVGDAPKHELLQRAATTTTKRKGDATEKSASSHAKHARPHTGSNVSGKTGAVVERASDDYCLERFKRNMKFNRSSKIKIA
jgi:hypothetical protein